MQVGVEWLIFVLDQFVPPWLEGTIKLFCNKSSNVRGKIPLGTVQAGESKQLTVYLEYKATFALTR